MAVKTPWGATDRQIVENSVLQGDTFGSLLAAVQVDTIAQEVEKAGVGYIYKEEHIKHVKKQTRERRNVCIITRGETSFF